MPEPTEQMVEAGARAIRNNTVFRNPPDNALASALSLQAQHDERQWEDISDGARRAMWLSDARACLTAALDQAENHE